MFEPLDRTTVESIQYLIKHDALEKTLNQFVDYIKQATAAIFVASTGMYNAFGDKSAYANLGKTAHINRLSMAGNITLGALYIAILYAFATLITLG